VELARLRVIQTNGSANPLLGIVRPF
jgi:hypothetical protein